MPSTRQVSVRFWLEPLRSRAWLSMLLPNRAISFSSPERRQSKTPSTSHDMLGGLFWRRPTLTRPIAVLPSGLQRFTSVFGMGTGGATALMSPEFCAGSFGAEFWRTEDFRLPIADCWSASSTFNFQKNTRSQIFNFESAISNCWFSDIYIQDFRSNASHSDAATTSEFWLRSFVLSVCWNRD